MGVPSDDPGLLDAAAEHSKLRTVVVRDQRVGACLAAGYATVTRQPAVLALTSGPPFPNALAGLAEASSLCVPLLVVTTRVSAVELGRGAFQETDQQSMAASLVKWHHLVQSAEQLSWAIKRAAYLSVSGRPGVTVVEIANEVLHEEEEQIIMATSAPGMCPKSVPEREGIKRAAELLRSSERPLIVAGGGAQASRAGPALLRLSEALSAPVMTTAAGRSTVPEDHPLAAGLVGLYATPPLDKLMAEADLVVAVGTRLEETARMGWPELSCQRLIHVDVDPFIFGQSAETDVALLGDAALTVELLLTDLQGTLPFSIREKWQRRHADLDSAARVRHLGAHKSHSEAREALLAVGEVFGSEAAYVHENGLHDIWSYHYPLLPIGMSSTVVVPGEQTMLGFGLPAAVGAAMADHHRPTVLLCGDGAFEMNLSAAVTAADYGIGLTVVVFDNAGFGWPRHLRNLKEDPNHLTKFSLSYPVDEVIKALGGMVSEPIGWQELRTALTEARKTSANGSIALIRVRVRDDDIPPGISRVLAGSVAD